ncbi:MAG TPA: hypothetical protein VGF63_00795 [Solirubrobacteraceae bacterium]
MGAGERQHVLERPMGAQTMYAAFCGGLRAGSYTLLTHDAIRETDVQIQAATIATLDRRAA